ncbi:hypothetical protein L873DRAFT_1228556 [Choiromyces venosus 120613-1]|uniref:Uncharacterized protein n=1 Tax=Choiromyces venosus 120613-1 TaxID=1336337 RepID=A0A3N4JDY4_9PEZI|nr:hypothetical protein L873DRAFT_1228556 [Choiromyces venosus 120613-1]
MPSISITSATIHGPETLINPLLKWYRTCQSAYDSAPENNRVWELINAHTKDGLKTLQAEELISHLRFRRAESCRVEFLMSEMGYPPRKPFEEFTRRDVVTVKQSFRDVIHLHSHCVYSPLIGRSDGGVVGGAPIGHTGVPVYWAVVDYAAWVAADWKVEPQAFAQKLENQYQALVQSWSKDKEGLETGAHTQTFGRFEGAAEYSSGWAATQVAAAFETIFPETWTEALPRAWYVGEITDDYGTPEPFHPGSDVEPKGDDQDAELSQCAEQLVLSSDEGDSAH